MKHKVEYVCSNCGYKSPKWLGKCLSCGLWDTFEEVVKQSEKQIRLISKSKVKSYLLSDISTAEDFRLVTGINELDRVLGGGVVPGSIVLVGGDPGIGKSTLLLQMCGNVPDYKPLYITGEESLQQIKLRSSRLTSISDKITIIADNELESIIDYIENSESQIIVIDSIQSIYSNQVDSTPGSVIQVRECASLLMQKAKSLNKAIFIIGHVTKDGFIAGPKILEHMVDTVLQFEGEKTYTYRILRALKNRFGSTNEIGIFEMHDNGLTEVTNPSELFLVNRRQQDPGVAIVAAVEGSRPILLEVQALVSTSGYAVPQRTVNGIELRRLQMILAVLERRMGIHFRNHDVFVNIAGGVFLNDPAIDLGIAAALVSSHKDKPINSKYVLIGEIGLTGEVRQVSAINQRLKEASKLGFTKAFIPVINKGSFNIKGIHISQVERISLALGEIFS